MAWSGGTYTLYANYLAVSGETISSTHYNGSLEDLETALNLVLLKDGSGTVTGDIPFSTNKITGLGDPTDAQDAATKAYVDGFGAGSTALDDTDSPYSLLATDQGKTLLCDTTSGALEIDLLAAATAGDGFEFTVKRTNSAGSNLTVDQDGTETIDGSTSPVFLTSSKQSLTFLCDGTGWQVLDEYRVIVDEDDLSSDTAFQAPTQQSVKAFIDNATFIDAATANTALAIDDYVFIWDESASTGKKVSTAIMGAQFEHSSSPAASTSGTTVDFTSIPAGVDWIEVILNNVSLATASDLIVQIGDSGGIETSSYSGGYLDSAGNNTSTAGFGSRFNDAAALVYATYKLTRVTGNAWVASWTGYETNSGRPFAGAGGKSTSAELDRVRVTSESAGTFDGGAVKLVYGFDA